MTLLLKTTKKAFLCFTAIFFLFLSCQSLPPEVELYQAKDYTKEECLEDLKKHKGIPIDEQIKLFENQGNRRSWIQNLEKDLTSNTLLMLKSLNTQDIQISNRIKSQKYANSEYLKLAKKYLDDLDFASSN